MKTAAWKVQPGSNPLQLQPTALDLERHLHDWIEADPSLVLPGLSIVGREVRLDAGRLDLLAFDPAGRWVVIEIKVGYLYREVVAQALDYVASVEMLSDEELRRICEAYLGGRGQGDSQQLLHRAFPQGGPAGGRRDVSAIIVGTGRDAGLERLTSYLAERHQVPFRAVTFEVFELDSGERVLVREVTETLMASGSEAAEDPLEPILALADQNGHGPSLRRIMKAAEAVGIHPRPVKRCVMFTPPSHQNRTLFTIWADGNVWTSASSFAEFYAVTEDEVVSSIGPDGWRTLDPDTVDAISDGLPTLLKDRGVLMPPDGPSTPPLTVESLLATAKTAEIRAQLEVILAAAERLRLPVRLWKTCVMLAPPAHRGRALLTAWTDGNIGVWGKAFEQFFGVPAVDVDARFGDTWSHRTMDDVQGLIGWLERVIPRDDEPLEA